MVVIALLLVAAFASLTDSLSYSDPSNSVTVEGRGIKFQYVLNENGCLINGAIQVNFEETFVLDVIGPCVWWLCDANGVHYVEEIGGRCTLPGGNDCYEHGKIHEVADQYCRCEDEATAICV